MPLFEVRRFMGVITKKYEQVHSNAISVFVRQGAKADKDLDISNAVHVEIKYRDK